MIILLPHLKNKTTTIQISLKTKKHLDELKEKEQLSNYDAIIRIILLNYKFSQEINLKENPVKKGQEKNKT